MAMERDVAQSDEELIRQWAGQKSADAFAVLVGRYAGLVHSVATRALNGDRMTADDVTQAVFIILSNKAGQISAKPSLAAWLHRVTCYAAANARRVNARRRNYEQAAAAERSENVMESRANSELNESLDAAINRLSNSDRQLIVERYFLGQDESATAAALGLSRSALQKRLSRAIGRLRDLLGGSAAAAALPTLLAAQTSSPMSATIVERLAQTALGGPMNDAVGPIVRMTGRKLAMDKALTVGKLALLPVAGLGLTIAVILATTAPADPPATIPATAITAPATAPVQDNAAEAEIVTTQADADALAKQMIGRWRVKAGWKGGRPMPAAEIERMRFNITADRFEVSGPDTKSEGASYVLMPGGRYVTLDIRDDDRPGRSLPGIIAVKDGRLRLAFDDRRFQLPGGFMPEVVSPKAMELERIEP